MESENEYIDYYVNQIGNGITGFSGSRYQTGNSWKSFFKILKPVLQYIAKVGLKTAANIGTDILEGESFSTSAVNRLKESGKIVGKEAINKISAVSDQLGSGIRKRKYMKRKKDYWISKKRKICRKKSINRIAKRKYKAKTKISKSKRRLSKINKLKKIICPY